MAEERIFSVAKSEHGRRLDQFLATRLADFSRVRLQRLIDEGRVLVDGAWRRRSFRLRGEEEVCVYVPDVEASDVLPEDIPLDIVHQDRDLLVVSKPAGMVVHPTQHESTGTLVNALLYHVDDLSGICGVERPGIVHRLDKLTTGLLVVAKNDRAHEGLADQFRDHTTTRRYMALVWGRPIPSEGTIISDIGRHPTERIKMSSRAQHGKRSETHYRVTEDLGPVSRLELVLETGRTHQIRVHMSEKQHAVVGDPVYGGLARRYLQRDSEYADLLLPVERQLLHAFHLGFEHPGTGDYMAFNEDPPPDFQAVWDGLRRLAAD